MSSDNTLLALAKFASQSDIKLSDQIQNKIILHLIDSFGCAFGGINSNPAKIFRKIAGTAQLETGSSVFGLKYLTTPEYAAMSNTAMVRYMDFNDTGNGGHPSDMIPAVLSLAEYYGVNGERVLKAIFLIYETYSGIRKGGLFGNLLRKKHIDQIYATIAGAVACSFVLNLNQTKAAHAISLSITPNIPMRATRTGKISYWKSSATSQISLMVTLSSRLAFEGMTGPEKPFEGSGGFYQMFNLNPIDLSNLGKPDNGMYAIESTGFKIYPANYNAQGPAYTIIQLRKEINIDEIECIEVYLHWGGWHSQGGGAGDKEAKWNPKTREEAENSMAYVVAVSLLDGDLSYDSFSEERISSSDVRSMIKKVEVHEDTQLTEIHAGVLPKWPCRIKVRLINGGSVEKYVESPKGHPLNPITRDDVVNKYMKLVSNHLAQEKADNLLKSIYSISQMKDINLLMGQIR